jgi:recombination protein RecA
VAVKRKKSKAVDENGGQSAATESNLITSLVDGIVKEYGAGKAQRFSDGGLKIQIRGVISTQCPTIDNAIGRGGIPLGRLTIIQGPEAGGKTTLCLHLAAECQRRGGVVVYIDAEYKLDPEYAAKLGVDMNRVVILYPTHLEEAFSMMEKATLIAKRWREESKKDVPILVTLDSMNAAISKAELEGDWDDQHYAPQARVFSQSLKKIIPLVSKENVALCFVSQIRQKIGVMFGDGETTAGGKAPRFYASLMIDIRRIGSVKRGEEVIGSKCKAKMTKNQIAAPFATADFEIRFGRGIDLEGSLIDLGIEKGVVEKAGSWFSFDGARLGQGKVNASEFLQANPKTVKRLTAAIEKA